MMSEVQFKCTCGACAVKAVGDPVMQVYCHCDDCQAAAGGPYVARSIYPKGQVEVVSGETRSWTYKTNTRTFCARCGVTLFSEPPGDRFTGCNAALFPAGAFKPTAHIQCQSAMVPVKDDLPHYRDWPPGVGGTGELVGW